MEKIAEHLSNSIVNSVNEKLAMINLHGGGLSAGNAMSNFLRKNVKNPINNAMFSMGIKNPMSSINNFKQYMSMTPSTINDTGLATQNVNDKIREIIRMLGR